MLSDRFYRMWGTLALLYNRLGVSNLSWDRNLKKYSPTQQKPRAIFIFNIISIGIWFSFVLLQVIRFYNCKDWNSVNLTFTFFLGACLGLEIFVITNFFPHENLCLYNAILMFLRQINSKFFKIIRNKYITYQVQLVLKL